MRKKSIGLGVALAILAMAILPGAASASLYSGTTLLSTGTKVVGNTIASPYFEDRSGNIVVTCSGSQFEGEVVQNGTLGKSRINVTSFTYYGIGSEGKCQTTVGDARISLDTPMCFVTQGGTSEWQAAPVACGANAAGHYPGMTWVYGSGTEHYTREELGNLYFPVAQSSPLQLSLKSGQIFNWDSGLALFTSLAPRGTWEVKTAAGATIRVA